LLPPTSDRAAVLAVTGAVTRQSVRDGLEQRLEEVRLPGACHVLDSLPLQPSGKVDKEALERLVRAGDPR
jgi:non-ribosomal peptide synthetase component E (peptide arylation enzyme)